MSSKLKKSLIAWDFPGDVVIDMPHFKATGIGPVPGGGTKMPHAVWQGKKKNLVTALKVCEQVTDAPTRLLTILIQ